MARNKEKAQSMLHRFAAAQAIELGIASKRPDRRPRLASSVSNLKECEKWRGDVLRDISRKVSKIQDFGLTDFEVRDLNDEINKLIREKSHWENQIMALGGANYKRGVPKMLDDSGREVPGTRGYKYFGRAKDLPGVKELLTRSVEQEEELESFKGKKYRRFEGLPGAYYGDEDEDDGVLLGEEKERERDAWVEGWRDLLQELGEDVDGEVPPLPRREAKSMREIREQAARPPPDAPSGPRAMQQGQEESGAGAAAKRKAGAKAKGKARGNKKLKGSEGEAVEEEEEEEEDDDEAEEAEEQAPEPQPPQSAPDAAAGGFSPYSDLFNVLEPGELQPVAVPDREATEKYILQARKKALREQYIGAA